MRKSARANELIALLCLMLALTAAGMWADLLGYSANLLAYVTPSIPADYSGRVVYLCAFFVSSILIFVFARQISKAPITILAITALLMSMATGAFVLAGNQLLFEPHVLLVFGTFVSQCCYNLLTTYAYIYLAQTMKTEQVVFCIAISLVLETVLSILVSLFLNAPTQAFVVVLAPVAFSVLYYCAIRIPLDPDKSVTADRKAEGAEKTILVVEVILFSIVMVFIRTLSKVGDWGKSASNFTGMIELSVEELCAITCLVLALAYLVFILPRKRVSLFIRCIIGFVVTVAGLQLLALVNDLSLGGLFDSISTSLELFSHLVRWMIVVDCIRRTDINPFRIAVISGPFYAAVSYVWMHFFENSGLVSSIFVMALIYVLLLSVVALLFFREKTGNGLADEKDAERSFAEKEFEEKWHLSPRESDIFELLVRGKKRREIQRECELSEGTVKTHIASIYRKLDVHSKREMLDLFAEYGEARLGQNETRGRG